MTGRPPSARRRPSATAAPDEVVPAGLGVGIVFVWALATQLTVQGIAGAVGALGLHLGAGGVAVRLGVAAILVLLGEGLRQGVEIARWAVIALALLVTLPGVTRGLAFLGGHRLPASAVLSELIVVTWTPWIVWRLSARRTVRWFHLTGGWAERLRRRGPWYSALAGWTVIAVLVAIQTAGAHRGLPLPSGRTASLRITMLVDLLVIPAIAWLVGRPRGMEGTDPDTPRASRATAQWLVRLAVWSIPWGVAVAVSQSI